MDKAKERQPNDEAVQTALDYLDRVRFRTEPLTLGKGMRAVRVLEAAEYTFEAQDLRDRLKPLLEAAIRRRAA